MTTGQQLNGFNYDDFVPTEGILCPICTVNCHSLENLNRHLDKEHSEEDSKGALLSWLKNAHKKVTNTLTPATIPANNSPGKLSSSPPNSTINSNNKWVEPPFISFQNLSFSNSNPTFFVSDTDKQSELVTREHWQRETGNDRCNIPGCHKIVGQSGAGKQHCRKCGRLFCNSHTQYEIKLNKRAQHDPEHGAWSKVCLNCYVHRKGYIETEGVTRNETELFMKRREKTIDRVHLECNRLEKRLERLAIIHQSTDMKKPSTPSSPTASFTTKAFSSTSLLSPSSASINSLSLERSDSTSSRESLGSMLSPKSSFVSNSNSILSMKLKYRDGEQSVIKWEDDRSVKACPYCGSTFTLINRKHHCRLCGKVVCGNVKCSKMIPLFTDMSSDTFDDVPVGDTRACRDCQRYVFRRKLRNEEVSKPLPIFQLYNQQAIARKNIEKMLPKFHDAMMLLEKENIKSQTHDMFVKAAKIRKTLLDNFTLYDTLAKSIKVLPARSPCMKRLQTNICNAASLYLQQNMLPLQMLPRILKSATASTSANGKRKKKSTPERLELQTQLEAYTEQYQLVEGFIKEANAERKYDDVRTLKASLDELSREISRLQNLLGED